MSLASLLQEQRDILTLLPNNKVRCSVTGHEMKPDLKIITAHLNGKKFMKTKARKGDDLSKFAPYIIPDVENEKKMFCKLTGFSLNPRADEIERHMKGKKFQRLKIEYDEIEERKVQKLKEKEARRREREEMEKEGIWVPSEAMLESDDDYEEEGNTKAKSAGDSAGDSDDNANCMDEDEGGEDEEGGDDEDDDSLEDWIITSPRLERMKRHGIAIDNDDFGPSTDTLASSNNKTGQSRQKGTVVAKKRGIDEATTKKKSRGGREKNKQKVA